MKRLFIDLEICSKCEECKATCDYFYHLQNQGVSSLRELATFALLCRQCTEAPCVSACYHDALEKQPDATLKRYKMRCSSCKSCSIACPFGVIFPDLIPYLDSKCDYCIFLGKEKLARCVSSCSEKAIQIKEVQENPDENIYFIGESLAVHSRKWSKEDIQLKKK